MCAKCIMFYVVKLKVTLSSMDVFVRKHFSSDEHVLLVNILPMFPYNYKRLRTPTSNRPLLLLRVTIENKM